MAEAHEWESVALGSLKCWQCGNGPTHVLHNTPERSVTAAYGRVMARRQARESARRHFASLPEETQSLLRAQFRQAEACIGWPGCDGRPCYCPIPEESR